MISIVIPTYNHLEDALKPCLENVLKYTNLVNKEIIIVANGCTDGTKAYLDSLNVPNLKYLWYNNPIGYIRAVNAGIKESKGEYVVLLDNDSILSEQPVDLWINILQKPFNDPLVGASSPFAHEYEGLGLVLHSGCTMYRKSILDKIGFFDEIYNPGYLSDSDIALRIGSNGYKCVEVPEGQEKPYINGMFSINFPVVHTGYVQTMDKVKDEPIIRINKQTLEKRFKKTVSIVIPTYNHIDDLKLCVSSILNNTKMNNVELIIVSNGSTDGTDDYVKNLGSHYDVKLVSVPAAIGYTKATNLGMKISSGKYVILLNNDVQVLSNNWLDLLIDPIIKDKKIGITGPLKFWWPCEQTFREAMAFWCVAISREVIDKIGYLDEIFSPGMGEDGDYSIRAVEAGFKIEQIPLGTEITEFGQAVKNKDFPIFHAGSSTFGDVKNREDIIKLNSRYLEIKYGNAVDKAFNECKNHPCDADEHFEVFKKYAKECRHITEFGVRDVYTTIAWLAAKPDELVSYDIYLSPNIWTADTLAKQNNVKFTFMHRDVLKEEIAETDLLFIDTKHTYSQLIQELNKHASKVKKYIIMHDVTSFGLKGEENEEGLWKAIHEFLLSTKEWHIREHHYNNNGILILERIYG